jgi:hypothetical protein
MISITGAFTHPFRPLVWHLSKIKALTILSVVGLT